MSKKKIFIATVQLAFPAEDHNVTDALSYMLTEGLEFDGDIIDWRYLPDNAGNYPDPIFAGTFELDYLEEGEIFNYPKKERPQVSDIFPNPDPKETLEYLLTDIKDNFPNLSEDEDSVQYDWVTKIKATLEGMT